MSPGVGSEKYLDHGWAVSYIDGKGRVHVSARNECIGTYQPRQEVLPL
jgi:hypothetical protein